MHIYYKNTLFREIERATPADYGDQEDSGIAWIFGTTLIIAVLMWWLM